MFAMQVQRVLCDVAVWLEQVHQDVCNVQSDVAALQAEARTLRTELDRLRAEVAQMKRKQRFQELVAQEAKLVFSDAGDVHRRAAREAELGVVELVVVE